MASQLRRVTRDPRLRRNQEAELQARMRFLPQIMANKASKRIEAKQDAQFEKSIGVEYDKLRLQKKRDKLQKRAEEAGMGLEAAKFGTGFAFSELGKNTVGGLVGAGKSLISPGSAKTSPTKSSGALKTIGSMTTGSIVGSGLTGFGVGRLIGGSKKKRAIGGALAGGLMSLLSGNSSNWKGAGTNFGLGSLLGGIGGLL